MPARVIVARATALASRVGTEHRDTSGEYKRHVVYAQLIKEYPKSSKRELGLAIECALNVSA